MRKNKSRKNKTTDKGVSARRPLLVSPLVGEEDVGMLTQRRQPGSGSGEAAHPSPSLHIGTICMAALKRVISSMQSRRHAVSACYTSVENCQSPPTHPHTHTLMNTHPHTHTHEYTHTHKHTHEYTRTHSIS